MNLIDIVKNHETIGEEEKFYKASFIQFLNNFEFKDTLVRENLIGHITSSAWVVNKEKTKTLFAYHNIYKSWAWLGGHAHGDSDFLHVAKKEAKEEAGVKNITAVLDKPIDLSVQTVIHHVKRGSFVPSHLHFNLTYLLEADENEDIFHKADENSAVGWINNNELLSKVSEENMKETYTRIMNKVDMLR